MPSSAHAIPTITLANLRPLTLSSDPAPSTIAFTRGRIARAAKANRTAPLGLGPSAAAWYLGYDAEHRASLGEGEHGRSLTISQQLANFPLTLRKRAWAFDAQGNKYLPEVWQSEVQAQAQAQGKTKSAVRALISTPIR